MHAAVHRCLTVCSLLVLVSTVAVTPVPPQALRYQIASLPTRLVDAESILNVPSNLFYDVINIPANELNAIQELSNALLFGGPWLVPSATNIWGIDVADPPKIEALTAMLLPFQALSEPLSQQLAGVYEAELPTNPACTAILCSDGVDLLYRWFNVAISQLTSGYYFDPTSPGSVDPEGTVASEFGFPGTQTIDGIQDLYPWVGTTFTLNLLEPLTDFWNSLTAAPSATPIEALPDIVQVLTNLAEGIVVAVDPFLPGGSYDPSDAVQLADPAAVFRLLAESNTPLSGFDLSEPGTLLPGPGSSDLLTIGSLGAEISTLSGELSSTLSTLF